MTDILKNFSAIPPAIDMPEVPAVAVTETEWPRGSVAPQRTVALSKEWGIALRNFTLVRDEVRADAAEFVASGALTGDMALAPSEESRQESALTDDERAVGQAYMLAKRAVRIALETNRDPHEIIGRGTDIQKRAKGYVSFILENMKSVQPFDGE